MHQHVHLHLGLTLQAMHPLAIEMAAHTASLCTKMAAVVANLHAWGNSLFVAGIIALNFEELSSVMMMTMY